MSQVCTYRGMYIATNFMNQEGFSIIKAQLITLAERLFVKKTHFFWMHIRILKNIILILPFGFNLVPGAKTQLVRTIYSNSA